MRKSIFMVLLGLLLAVPAFAAGTPNKAPTKELIVASDGEFTTITAALASISNASATNPYIIRVMPGIYNESITMKPYVDVVGSGRENTKITSSATATVTGANNSVLSNIWVENLPENYISGAILNSSASMDIRNVKATVDDVYGMNEMFGIKNTGSLTSTISNSIVSVKSGNGGGPLGIIAGGGSEVFIRDSQIDVSPNATYSQWNAGILIHWDAGYSKINVKNSTITVSGARSNYAVDIEGMGEIAIENSRMESIASADTIENATVRDDGRSITIVNSQVHMTGTGTGSSCALSVYGVTKIGGSLISGPRCDNGTLKIVNSWDGDFASIPNQSE